MSRIFSVGGCKHRAILSKICSAPVLIIKYDNIDDREQKDAPLWLKNPLRKTV